MTEKRALGPGAKCCGECDLCCCVTPPTAEEATTITIEELADELGIDLEEEDE